MVLNHLIITTRCCFIQLSITLGDETYNENFEQPQILYICYLRDKSNLNPLNLKQTVLSLWNVLTTNSNIAKYWFVYVYMGMSIQLTNWKERQ